MNVARRSGAVAGLLLVALLVGWVARHLDVDNDITAFLPAGADRELAALSTELAHSELTRTVTLAVGAPHEEETVRAAAVIAASLRESPVVAWVRGDGGEALEDAVYDLYFPRRMLLLSDAPETELPERLSDAGLARAAGALRAALASPTGGLARAVATEDPLMAFATQVERLEQARVGDLRTVDGQLVAADGSAIVLFASRASPFDAGVARALDRDVEAAIARAEAEVGASLRVERDGVYPMALASERQIRADIQRISLLSTLAIVPLFLLLFRSIRVLLLVSLPVVVGMASGTAVSLVVFGSIHGLTLAFGSTLIGVCVDYPVHLVNHCYLAGEGSPERSLRSVLPGLVLGAGTTVAGFAGLAWTSFPGLREMAVFASVGVVTALVATVWVVAPLVPPAASPGRLQSWLVEALDRGLRGMRVRQRWVLAVLLPLLLLTGVGWGRLELVDDVRALHLGDEELRAEAERVRRRVSPMEPGRFVVAVGDDEEEALARNDRAFAALEAAEREGALGDFRSLHPLLPSAALQRRAAEVLRSTSRAGPRIEAAFTEAGFRPGTFAPFAAALDDPPPPLTWDELAASPLADLTRAFRATLGERVAFLTFLRDVRDPEALAARFDGVDGIYYFDQMDFMEDAYERYRVSTVRMILVGLLAVFALVVARYRSVRLSLVALLPALLGAAATVGLLGWLGVPLQLIHVVALLLVLSMGADYGVFLAEERRPSEGAARTLLGVVIDVSTTVLSFGLLALSAQPALRAIGLTVSVGVISSFLLAPVSFVLFTDSSEGAP